MLPYIPGNKFNKFDNNYKKYIINNFKILLNFALTYKYPNNIKKIINDRIIKNLSTSTTHDIVGLEVVKKFTSRATKTVSDDVTAAKLNIFIDNIKDEIENLHDINTIIYIYDYAEVHITYDDILDSENKQNITIKFKESILNN